MPWEQGPREREKGPGLEWKPLCGLSQGGRRGPAQQPGMALWAGLGVPTPKHSHPGFLLQEMDLRLTIQSIVVTI